MGSVGSEDEVEVTWPRYNIESLLPEFDKQKAYILVNQNITLKEAATFLANNKVQILRDYATRFEIEATTMTVKIKQG